jgi:hypothetical protein
MCVLHAATVVVESSPLLAFGCCHVFAPLVDQRQSATEEMQQLLQELRRHFLVGVVGGSDLVKQKEQLGEDVIHNVDYSFSENGLVAYKNGQLIGTTVTTRLLAFAGLRMWGELKWCVVWRVCVCLRRSRTTWARTTLSRS